jgi:release factor glutamine methyltransferase
LFQQSLYTRALQTLKNNLSILPDKNEETEENTLHSLWHVASGTYASPIAAAGLTLPPLSEAQIAKLDELILQRLAGVPLAHLTERQHFMGMELWLKKGHYIPRKETELLAKAAINTINHDFAPEQSLSAIDLGTGIGTLALAMAYHCTNVRVWGTDIFDMAITAAKANSEILQINQRTQFALGSLFEPLAAAGLNSPVDLVVSAPPYISSAKVKKMAVEIAEHEPEQAFDAGPFGLSIFNQIISHAPKHLRSGGYLLLECGLGQGEFLAKQIRAKGCYSHVETIADDDGNLRVLKAQLR